MTGNEAAQNLTGAAEPTRSRARAASTRCGAARAPTRSSSARPVPANADSVRRLGLRRGQAAARRRGDERARRERQLRRGRCALLGLAHAARRTTRRPHHLQHHHAARSATTPTATARARAQLIATLQSGATLVATDIAVEGGSSGGGQPINGTAGNDSLVGGRGQRHHQRLRRQRHARRRGRRRPARRRRRQRLAGRRRGSHDVLIGGDGDDTLDGRSARISLTSEPVAGHPGRRPRRRHLHGSTTRGDALTDAGGTDTVAP